MSSKKRSHNDNDPDIGSFTKKVTGKELTASEEIRIQLDILVEVLEDKGIILSTHIGQPETLIFVNSHFLFFFELVNAFHFQIFYSFNFQVPVGSRILTTINAHETIPFCRIDMNPMFMYNLSFL